MVEILARASRETVHVVRGQHHRFMLIPILQDEIEWFPAGPVTFGVEARARDRLPVMLRGAGADTLAERVERDGFDTCVLDGVAQAMIAAHQKTFPGTELAIKGREWMHRWKEIHPQFNTAD